MSPNLHVYPQHEQQAVSPPTPNCPPRAFSYSRSSKNSSSFKCSSRKRILKKFSFLSHWKCLKSAICVYLLGQGGSSCPFRWGWKWYRFFLEQNLSINQMHSIPCGWDSRSDFFQSWRVTAGLCATFFIEAWFSGHLWAVAAMSVGRKQCVKEELSVWIFNNE